MYITQNREREKLIQSLYVLNIISGDFNESKKYEQFNPKLEIDDIKEILNFSKPETLITILGTNNLFNDYLVFYGFTFETLFDYALNNNQLEIVDYLINKQSVIAKLTIDEIKQKIITINNIRDYGKYTDHDIDKRVNTYHTSNNNFNIDDILNTSFEYNVKKFNKPILDMLLLLADKYSVQLNDPKYNFNISIFDIFWRNFEVYSNYNNGTLKLSNWVDFVHCISCDNKIRQLLVANKSFFNHDTITEHLISSYKREIKSFFEVYELSFKHLLNNTYKKDTIEQYQPTKDNFVKIHTLMYQYLSILVTNCDPKTATTMITIFANQATDIDIDIENYKTNNISRMIKTKIPLEQVIAKIEYNILNEGKPSNSSHKQIKL